MIAGSKLWFITRGRALAFGLMLRDGPEGTTWAIRPPSPEPGICP